LPDLPPNFHLMAKPTGPRCNMRCEYCFYLEKERFYSDSATLCMSDEVLEAYTQQYVQANDSPEVVFTWQGGEPTLMGLEFFRKAVALQRRYANGKRTVNTLQTNGVLLDDEWCRFFSDENFLVGLSLDGPRVIYDRYRRTRSGKTIFGKVLLALQQMQEHKVEFNVLACINRESARMPAEVYRFLKTQGVRFIQFIPVVERKPDRAAVESGMLLARPDSSEEMEVTPWSVGSDEYGNFLIGVFDEWVRQDVGRVFIMNFEWTLAGWMGIPQASCTHAVRCGQALILEHNGDVFCCDHYMYPEYRLGNILTDNLATMVTSEKQRAFGAAKEKSLPVACRNCEMLFACRGGCPKHRFARSKEGEPGMNYLCSGAKRYFHHVEAYMNAMAQLIRQGSAVSEIMTQLNSHRDG
jgi:uncharacterized protein